MKLILKQNPEAIEESVKEGVLKLSAYEKRVLESVHTIGALLGIHVH